MFVCVLGHRHFWALLLLSNMWQILIVSTCEENNVRTRNTDNTPTEVCDQNIILLQLSRLYITSPERIVLLISQTDDICLRIQSVLSNLQKDCKDCIPLSDKNIYKRLQRGVTFFYNKICQQSYLARNQECLQLLQDDLLDCEAIPDWYEQTEQKLICQDFKDIINCFYVKAAMLCGLKVAHKLRSFSSDVINQVLEHKCSPSHFLPKVNDPMPDSCRDITLSNTMSKLYSTILAVYLV